MEDNESVPSEFELITMRMKKKLALTTDAQVANMLCMNPQAFYERKKRNSFPIKALLTLMEQQPGLPLDYDYIVNGVLDKIDEIDDSHLDEAMFQLSQLNTTQQHLIMGLINQLYLAQKEIDFYTKKP